MERAGSTRLFDPYASLLSGYAIECLLAARRSCGNNCLGNKAMSQETDTRSVMVTFLEGTIPPVLYPVIKGNIDGVLARVWDADIFGPRPEIDISFVGTPDFEGTEGETVRVLLSGMKPSLADLLTQVLVPAVLEPLQPKVVVARAHRARVTH